MHLAHRDRDLRSRGHFATAGGVAAQTIARWDGTNWSALGSGTKAISAMTIFDDGTGPALHATGFFGFSGTLHDLLRVT
jgi:hypothetical protein